MGKKNKTVKSHGENSVKEVGSEIQDEGMDEEVIGAVEEGRHKKKKVGKNKSVKELKEKKVKDSVTGPLKRKIENGNVTEASGDTQPKKKKSKKDGKKSTQDSKKEEKVEKTKKKKKAIINQNEEKRNLKIPPSGKPAVKFDLHFEENDLMTNCSGVWILREDVEKLQQFKASLQDKNEESKRKLIMFKKRKFGSKLKKKLIQEIKKMNEDQVSTPTPTPTPSPSKQELVPLIFEENHMMTMYEDVWVQKTAIPKLEAIALRKLKQIHGARTGDNMNVELTAKEQSVYDSFMKKQKRSENKRLRMLLIKNGRRQAWEELRASQSTNGKVQKRKKKQPGKYLNIDYANDPNITKYNGFYVKKEAVKLLDDLKDQLILKGIPEKEWKKQLKLASRKQERLMKTASRQQERLIKKERESTVASDLTKPTVNEVGENVYQKEESQSGVAVDDGENTVETPKKKKDKKQAKKASRVG